MSRQKTKMKAKVALAITKCKDNCSEDEINEIYSLYTRSLVNRYRTFLKY